MKLINSVKIKLVSIIALAVTAVLTLCAAFGIIVARADRGVTISGTSVFITSADAEIWSHQVKAEGGDEYYTMFALKNNEDSVNFRKNLAYTWVYAESQGEDEESAELKPVTGWFGTEIGFELTDGKLGFEKFVIAFESQQHSQTKDGKSANYIIFVPSEDKTKLNVLITDDKDAEVPVNAATAIGHDHIAINFTDYDDGEYSVEITCGEDKLTGTFKNVGGTYARFSSSTTTPVTPMSFSAEFESEATSKLAKMIMYNLNGQSFKLNAAPSEVDGHYKHGQVNDVNPPVLCLDKGVSFIQHNGEISFNYTVIDVLASSPSIETSYFMLTKTDAANTEFKADEYKKEGLFTVVKDSDDQKMVPHVEHYVPTAANCDEEVFGKDMDVTAAVKVLLKLKDTTASGGQETYLMLDWYVKDEYLVNVNGNKYIAVASDKEGATYTHTSKDATTLDEAWQTKLNEYQAKVDEASRDLMAGSKNYFYLPSVASLFNDNLTAYEDLTFHIYYISNSRQQVSSKKSNALSIQLNRAGRYIFTVYAVDAQSNNMYYFDKDGEKQTFASSEIWDMYDDDELKDYLPWFTFDVEASEISIEEPEEQTIAYVGSTYTPDSFGINGVSYDTKYSLYVFNSDEYKKDQGKTLSYSEFMEQKEKLINDGENGRRWFTYIFPSSELQEGTDVYEQYSEYKWNSKSPSFVPQDPNTFYLIKCEVKSTDNSGTPGATAYMGIASAPKVKTLRGEDTWVQDNMVSIILLCVAGASLIGIVLLLVIRPKDKGDLDEIDTVKSKSSKK